VPRAAGTQPKTNIKGEQKMPDPAPLIAESTVRIQASPDAVWKVLTSTAHIREWDDVPADFTADALSAGSILEWEGHAVLAVTEYAPPGCLRMSFHSPKWPEAVPGIEYAYMIRPLRDCCELAIRVGDWSLAPDGKGQDYFDASVDFVADAAGKIKDIAERG